MLTVSFLLVPLTFIGYSSVCWSKYAYIVVVLVTGQLSQEIMEIIAEIGQLFGVLSEDVMQLA